MNCAESAPEGFLPSDVNAAENHRKILAKDSAMYSLCIFLLYFGRFKICVYYSTLGIIYSCVYNVIEIGLREPIDHLSSKIVDNKQVAGIISLRIVP